MDINELIGKLATKGPSEQKAVVRVVVDDYLKEGKQVEEIIQGLVSACESMDRKTSLSLAEEFRFYWMPGHTGDEIIYRVFTTLEKIARSKPWEEEPAVEGEILEGWIVWERFPDYQWTEAKATLRDAAQSKRVTDSILAEGPSGWVIYADREIAEEMSTLLHRAGGERSVPVKVRCFTSGTDPRIPSTNVRTMENGYVIEDG